MPEGTQIPRNPILIDAKNPLYRNINMFREPRHKRTSSDDERLRKGQIHANCRWSVRDFGVRFGCLSSMGHVLKR